MEVKCTATGSIKRCFRNFTLVLTFTVSLFVAKSADAQVQPSKQTAQLVEATTVTFFNTLMKNDFKSERIFLADSLKSMVSEKEWEKLREGIINEMGKTPSYVAHQVTYYQQKNILAAVDFSASVVDKNAYVCGYAIWEIAKNDKIGLVRIEQNIVKTKLFKKMPVQDAAQLMTNWRCPAQVIEVVLSIKLNKS